MDLLQVKKVSSIVTTDQSDESDVINVGNYCVEKVFKKSLSGLRLVDPLSLLPSTFIF